MSAASSMNILGAFCGKRDVPALTRECLKERYSFEEADVMVLFGASVLAGGEVLAGAMKAGAAKTYIIVGGAGHTTPVLREKMHAAFPEIITEGRPEAELMLHRPGLTVVNYAVYSAEMRKNSSDARCGSSGGG